ncbi:hypothetical protein E4V99_15215 [Microbacterium sp. dk485]|uniref:hypothetical protein n=1 Tax=Microbacterium TaxID=33882 RepID=UPI00107357BA|nr:MULTISPECIES: hypothetical protein [Microbacterium]TFV82258.1 hypothetical protein E4V99_15215 [Microbacterium sp. dk485]TXK20413.1 hypothetical protein FVP99_01920 [Microbacterium wangchenii]
MTTPSTTEYVPAAKRRRRVGRGTVLILGVVVIPVVLGAALNSYGPLTEDTAIWMAFATVAGKTITILSAIIAVTLTIQRRYAWPAILGMVLIAALITTWAIGGMASAGDLLLERLDLVAEVDRLNR